jgi:Rad3-related DNA helicase
MLPAPFLKPRFAATRTTVLFSATLTPQHFYADTLGLPDNAGWLDVPAPFRADQLSVRIVRNVSTRFRDRARSLAPIADLMAAQYAVQPGNYLAFFSSFDYLEQAATALSAAHPAIPVWAQTRRMDDHERARFLARFRADSRGIGFAVLGGTFAEGIDLPGERLIGAFIATLGLPQFNAVNEEMRRRIEAGFGTGYDYAYLYPGIRKVVQAAGRVIRSTTDRGSVHLIDDRFARADVMRLLPAWWHVECTNAVIAGPPDAWGRPAENRRHPV